MQFVETPISKKNLDFRNVYNIKGLFKMVLTIWKTFIRQFIFFWQLMTFFFFQRNLLIEDSLALSPFFINSKTWVLMQWQVFSFFFVLHLFWSSAFSFRKIPADFFFITLQSTTSSKWFFRKSIKAKSTSVFSPIFSVFIFHAFSKTERVVVLDFPGACKLFFSHN